ncbi:Peptide-N(4)-(N-acetyl-beta-glucosaminyl)asparagine amidase [Chionoecetes opilio]|uniref:Peptide-N(4)-(N-acetyl-beta-glucosaminyl)asparagine amidase n=1 Tax=Chionoecetes opilio TaxID=41210 RepID=A0A8J5D2Y9_CHIOP|nr:Peptide-N(4)-(N-acetyl-beta-glucosaminyl)asparagine amidase [Chionoecetes opilio]
MEIFLGAHCMVMATIMAEMSTSVTRLLQGDLQAAEGAVNVLIKIAGNVLREPLNAKFRVLNLSNPAIRKKVVEVVGALEILFLMGFEEGEDQLFLPQDASLDNIRSYQDQLRQWKVLPLMEAVGGAASVSGAGEGPVSPPSPAPPQFSEAEMMSVLVTNFERVRVYEDAELQGVAKSLMPVQRLTEQATSRLATINRDIGETEKAMDLQDCLLIELLAWFKGSFFTWFDLPTCPVCDQRMTSVGCDEPCAATELGAPELWRATDALLRQHSFVRQDCSTAESFVRYNHPRKLLETRRGRCGEWANCFTLLCRTLGMDARYIWDATDHVWTEVYSQSQMRWLHADCCENKMDSPLMYEHGWGKKLSYIFAFSKDEVTDVTWRYTAKRKEIMPRRNRCGEQWLAERLLHMNNTRREGYPAPQVILLDVRKMKELAEFTVDNTVKESEREGRSSGSLEWRLSRGETQTQVTAESGFVFRLNPKEAEEKVFEVTYSPSVDQYQRRNGLSGAEGIMKGWRSG